MNLFFPVPSPAAPADEIQGRLLRLAALFLGLYAAVLTLAPAVRYHSWEVAYRWQHWLGLLCWLCVFALGHRQTQKYIPDRDPYLFPIAGLLSGLGLLTIWRLSPEFGLRQTIWLAVAGLVFMQGLRQASLLDLLKRYKYLWLTCGLILTAVTFLVGTYPGGLGPRLWIGCCGVYLQPSEPLKLLLIVYLAAYLAQQLPGRSSFVQLVLPTLLLTGITLGLLLAQRDLGTASIFIILYASMLYIATARRRVLFVNVLFLFAAGSLGYLLFDVVRIRIDAWINPWLDPSGRSFQIVQSLISISGGGLFGHGPGLGSPGVVPVAQSDFIFAAIGEELGLLGTAGLVLLLIFFALRGLNTAVNAGSHYQRLLAAGTTIYLAAQAVFIIGGNLRLLPLTGVTLPFISYGGSSLLTAFIALLFLLQVSQQPDQEPAPLPAAAPYRLLGGVLIFGLLAIVAANSWWSFWKSAQLTDRPDNPRLMINDRFVPRGNLLDRENQTLSGTVGQAGAYQRHLEYIPLSPTIGYTHQTYGLAGIEASLDPYLRGLQGSPASTIWWTQLVYGQPPNGIDIRLSLSLSLQKQADQLLGSRKGAVVMLNAKTGEVLVMASHPYFDANHLAENWNAYLADANAPLLNRAAQGAYSPGAVLGPFLLAGANRATSYGGPQVLTFPYQQAELGCAVQPDASARWGSAILGGCPGAAAELAGALDLPALHDLFRRLGLYTAPPLPLPAASAGQPNTNAALDIQAVGLAGLQVSPLQIALAAAALSNDGVRPAPRLVLALDLPDQGWVTPASAGTPVSVFTSVQVRKALDGLTLKELKIWQSVGQAASHDSPQGITWYIGGSSPDWQGVPIAVAVLLEENAPDLAVQIGQALLAASQLR